MEGGAGRSDRSWRGGAGDEDGESGTSPTIQTASEEMNPDDLDLSESDDMSFQHLVLL